MAGPGYADIPFYHGDTLTFSITIEDDGVDLTGHVPKFQIRRAGTLVADWSDFVAVTGPQRLDVVVPGDPDPDGTGKPPRPARSQAYDYDLQLTSPAGTVRTILRGIAACTGDISHG